MALMLRHILFVLRIYIVKPLKLILIRYVFRADSASDVNFENVLFRLLAEGRFIAMLLDFLSCYFKY